MPRKGEYSCDINTNLEIVATQERNHEGKKYNALIGKNKDGKTTDAIYHYPKVWNSETAKSHCKEHDGTFHEAIKEHKKDKTYNMDNIEIAASGKWKGHTYTEKDLDEMIDAFNELQGKVNVPLVLGHDKDQKLLQQDGYSAAGWIRTMKRKGKKIIASIKGIPGEIKKLIDLGAYKSISPEIYPNYEEESTGKKYKNVLWRIALLGADHKAMTTLKDMVALYSNFNTASDRAISFKLEKPMVFEKFNCECIKCGHKMESDKHCNILKCPKCGGDMRREERPGEGQPHKNVKSKEKEVKKMELEEKVAELEKRVQELTDEKTELLKENEELTEKIKELKETEKERDELKNSIEEFEQKELDTKINSFVETAIKDGKLLPAQKDNVISVLKSKLDGTVKFTVSEDGKEEEKEGNLMDAIKEIFYAIPGSLVKMSEEFEHTTEESKRDKTLEKKTGVEVENVDLHNKIEKYAKENEVSYEDAYEAVVNE